MTNIILRNVPATIHAALRKSAASDNITLSDAVLEILAAALETDDAITVGFIPLVNGELDENYHCADCGGEVGKSRLFVPVVGVKFPKLAQPVCELCANTD